MVHARKKNTKISFFGPETAGWGRGLPHEGVVAERIVLSLESLSSLGFEGGVQKHCAKKFVRIFRSLNVNFMVCAPLISLRCRGVFVSEKSGGLNATQKGKRLGPRHDSSGVRFIDSPHF